MGFKVAGLDFEKTGNGIMIKDEDDNVLGLFYDSEWISVITEMSHKSENADQHEKAEKFHLMGDLKITEESLEEALKELEHIYSTHLDEREVMKKVLMKLVGKGTGD